MMTQETLPNLYGKLTAQLSHDKDSPSFGADGWIVNYISELQAIVHDLRQTCSDVSLMLTKLSVLKLFFEVLLKSKDFWNFRKIFEEVFPADEDFLGVLLQYPESGIPATYMLSETSAFLVFSAHKWDILAKYCHGCQDFASYLSGVQCSNIMKLRIVHCLCVLDKNYEEENFEVFLSQLFSDVVFDSNIAEKDVKSQILFVRVCSAILKTSAERSSKITIFENFGVFVSFIRSTDDQAVQKTQWIFLNELFPLYRVDNIEEKLIVAASMQLLKANNECPHLQDLITTKINVILKAALWILRGSVVSEDKILEFITVFSQISHTIDFSVFNPEKLVSVFIEDDDDLVDFFLIHLEIYGIFQKHNLTGKYQCSLLQITPWDLFLEFILNLSFDISILNDFLISNETNFLRYFVKFLKLTRLCWADFVGTCSSKDSISRFRDFLPVLSVSNVLDACLSVFIRLKIKIIRLHKAELYPYSPQPLIRLLSDLETTFEGVTHS